LPWEDKLLVSSGEDYQKKLDQVHYYTKTLQKLVNEGEPTLDTITKEQRRSIDHVYARVAADTRFKPGRKNFCRATAMILVAWKEKCARGKGILSENENECWAQIDGSNSEGERFIADALPKVRKTFENLFPDTPVDWVQLSPEPTSPPRGSNPMPSGHGRDGPEERIPPSPSKSVQPMLPSKPASEGLSSWPASGYMKNVTSVLVVLTVITVALVVLPKGSRGKPLKKVRPAC
jgi:hypothetical protein